MNFFGLFEKSKSFFHKPYEGILSKLRHLSGKSKEEQDYARAVITLAWAVINADEKAPGSELDEFKRILSQRHPEVPGHMLEGFLGRIVSDEEIRQAAELLMDVPETDRTEFVGALVETACSDGHYDESQKAVLRKICPLLGVPTEILPPLEQETLEKALHKKKMLRSGTGIILAVAVIFFFILTATFLKSVFFGLILAYFFLPLEKWFERRVFVSRPAMWCARMTSLALSPLEKLAETARKFSGRPPKNNGDLERKKIEGLVTKASFATVACFILVVFLIASSFVSFSASYMSGLQKSVGNIAGKVKVEIEKVQTDVEKHEAADDEAGRTHGAFQKYFDGVERKIEGLKPGLENSPWFRKGVDMVRKYLQDDQNLKELGVFLLSKTGGVFSFTAGFVGGFFSVVFNVVMTLFFFILLLQKMALSETISNTERNKTSSASAVTFRSIFMSKWMPVTSEESRGEAMVILENVIGKLKAWVRGYLSIIIIEVVLYTTAFSLLGVPYAHVVGLLAGCTILLPYVGPASSVALTVLVYFAAGVDPSMMNVIFIIGVYVVISGVVEQFVLYPMFVGESLGLTAIETIAIVLLGGALAGIPGMIFAVPTASVLKYLVSRTYKCWE